MTIDARYRRYRRELLASTWLSYAGFYVCRKVFAIVKSPLKERLGADDLQVSYLWTSYLVAYMFGQFLSAWLGRRFSSRKVLLVGMTGASLCNLAMARLTDLGASAYGAMLIAMATFGFAQATGWPHNVALVANWTHRSERGRVMAVWGTCYQVGAILAKVLAAFAFGWLGLSAPFEVSSIVLFAVTAVFFFWARENPEAHGLPPIEDDAPSITTERGDEAEDAIVMRTIVAMGLIYFGFKFIRYSLDSWTALILEEQFKLSTEQAGYLSSAYDVLGFVGVLFAGVWSDRGSRVRVMFILSTGCLVATLLLFLFGRTSWIAFVTLVGLIGLLATGPDSLLSGAGAMDVGSRRRAAMAAGIINGVGSIGPIIEEPAIGWLNTRMGLSSVLALLVAVTFVATIGIGVLWWNARRRRLPL
jgi:sugar phosphate permease